MAGIMPVPISNFTNTPPSLAWQRLRGRFITKRDVDRMANIQAALGHQKASALPFLELQAARPENLASATSGKVFRKVVQSVFPGLQEAAQGVANVLMAGEATRAGLEDALRRAESQDLIERLNLRIQRQRGRLSDYYKMLNMLKTFFNQWGF